MKTCSNTLLSRNIGADLIVTTGSPLLTEKRSRRVASSAGEAGDATTDTFRRTGWRCSRSK